MCTLRQLWCTRVNIKKKQEKRKYTNHITLLARLAAHDACVNVITVGNGSIPSNYMCITFCRRVPDTTYAHTHTHTRSRARTHPCTMAVGAVRAALWKYLYTPAVACTPLVRHTFE